MELGKNEKKQKKPEKTRKNPENRCLLIKDYLRGDNVPIIGFYTAYGTLFVEK